MPTTQRIGFHYHNDQEHYTAADLAAWLPRLKALGAAWLILRGSLARTVPEHFIRGLLEAGIEPVVHIAAHPIRRLDPVTFRPLLGAYARWGIRYVTFFEYANCRAAWDPFDWAQPGLVERFVDCLLPVLDAMHTAGLTPVISPLAPGGDYWDTIFLKSALKSLGRRGFALTKIALGTTLFTGNRPLDWGRGGPDAWPDARPYTESIQDQRGFRRYEWLDAIAQRATGGTSLKQLVIAGGATPGAHDLPHLPPVDLAAHTAQNIEIARRLAAGDVPAYVQNMAFWLLAAAPESAHAGHAWFTKEGAALPAAVQLIAKHTQKKESRRSS